MAIGMHVELNRRLGGHDGQTTEWEISTATASNRDRVLALQALDHPLLCAFVTGEDHRTVSFCVREGAPFGFVMQLIRYLTLHGDKGALILLAGLRGDL